MKADRAVRNQERIDSLAARLDGALHHEETAVALEILEQLLIENAREPLWWQLLQLIAPSPSDVRRSLQRIVAADPDNLGARLRLGWLRLEDLEARCRQLEEELASLEVRRQHEDEQLARLESEREELVKEQQCLQAEVETLRAERISLMGEAEGLRKQVQGLRSELRRAQEDYDKVLARQAQLRQAFETHSRLVAENAELQRKINADKRSALELEARNARLKDELDSTQKTLTQRQEDLRAAEAALAEMNQQASERQELAQELSRVRREVTLERQRLDTLLDRARSLDERTAEQEHRLSAETAELSAKTAELEQSLARIAELEVRRVDLEGQQQSLTQQVAKLAMQRDDLKKELQGLIARESRAKEGLIKAQSASDRLQAEIKELETKKAALQQSLADLETAIQEQQAQDQPRHTSVVPRAEAEPGDSLPKVFRAILDEIESAGAGVSPELIENLAGRAKDYLSLHDELTEELGSIIRNGPQALHRIWWRALGLLVDSDTARNAARNCFRLQIAAPWDSFARAGVEELDRLAQGRSAFAISASAILRTALDDGADNSGTG